MVRADVGGRRGWVEGVRCGGGLQNHLADSAATFTLALTGVRADAGISICCSALGPPHLWVCAAAGSAALAVSLVYLKQVRRTGFFDLSRHAANKEMFVLAVCFLFIVL